MVDLHYSHPDLVALYDVFNGWSADRDFYAALPGDEPMRILEVGCGTGLIARALGRQGHDVTGLDPSQRMLDFARQAPDGHGIEWICGLLTAFKSAPFDLIYMTGHAFQCMVPDDEINAFFNAAHRLLRPNGRLVFETRNPAARAWENWVPDKSTVTKTLPDGRCVTEWHALQNIDAQTVSFQSIYQFPDKQLVSASTLRFTSLEELRAFAQLASFEIVEVYGDWDKTPFSPSSPEIILTLRKR